MSYGGFYYGKQNVSIDFGLTRNLLELNLSKKDNELIEQELMDIIDLCNYNSGTVITEMEVIEGGMANTADPIEDWFHIIVTCYLELEGTLGIRFNIGKFKEKLSKLYLIGEYIDISTLDIDLWSAELGDYVEYEPDWDSMPGGPDYYND